MVHSVLCPKSTKCDFPKYPWQWMVVSLPPSPLQRPHTPGPNPNSCPTCCSSLSGASQQLWHLAHLFSLFLTKPGLTQHMMQRMNLRSLPLPWHTPQLFQSCRTIEGPLRGRRHPPQRWFGVIARRNGMVLVNRGQWSLC